MRLKGGNSILDPPSFNGNFLIKASDSCCFDNYIFIGFVKILALFLVKLEYTIAEVRLAK